MSGKKPVAKKALRSLHAFLITHLEPDLVHEFLARNLISDYELQTVQAERTSNDKNFRLLESLKRRDEAKVLDTLIELLEGEDGEKKDMNEEILRKIEKVYIPFYSYDKPESDNPPHVIPASNGAGQMPRGAASTIVPAIPPLLKPELSKSTQNDNREISIKGIQQQVKVLEDSDGGSPLGAYPMKSFPRGMCVLINNENFVNMKARAGSVWDAEALEELFGKFLGFHMETFKDLTSKDIMRIMESVRDYDHSQLSCLAVCILSHGVNGEIYGTDGQLVKVETITRTFVGTKCPSLAGKPKIFILQACRGGAFDHGVTVEQTDDGRKEVIEVDKVLAEDETDGGGYKIALPDESDFLLAYATTPGFVSWRNSAFGTWFIKAFTDTMKELAAKEHLMDILTEVNRKVAEEYHSREHKKQMPQPVTMLRYKLFLPPV